MYNQLDQSNKLNNKKNMSKSSWVLFFIIPIFFVIWLEYRGIHERGSGDVVSAVCYTIQPIYLSLCTQTAETTSPEPSWIPLYLIVKSHRSLLLSKFYSTTLDPLWPFWIVSFICYLYFFPSWTWYKLDIVFFCQYIISATPS